MHPNHPCFLLSRLQPRGQITVCRSLGGQPCPKGGVNSSSLLKTVLPESFFLNFFSMGIWLVLNNLVNDFRMNTVMQNFSAPKILLTYGTSFPLYMVNGISHVLNTARFCSISLTKILSFVYPTLCMCVYVQRWLSFNVLLNNLCTYRRFLPFSFVYTSDLVTFLGTDATASQSLQHAPHSRRTCAPQRLFVQASNPSLTCGEIRFGHEYI